MSEFTGQHDPLPTNLDTAWRVVVSALERVSDEAESETRWLFEHVGISPQERRWQPHLTLSAAQLFFLEKALQRRHQREPLQHILGTQAFRHLELMVSPQVLIPRPETEELVDRVLAYVSPLVNQVKQASEPLRILDIGTGSGAIALSLKSECPALAVWATDLSPEALQVARLNAERLGLDVNFRQGDGFGALNTEVSTELNTELNPRFDVLVSNPPYIPVQEWLDLAPEVRDYEPRHALTPHDPDPLYFYRYFAQAGPAFLKPGARAFFEIHSALGPETQACFVEAGWLQVDLHRDFSQRHRFIEAVCPPTETW